MKRQAIAVTVVAVAVVVFVMTLTNATFYSASDEVSTTAGGQTGGRTPTRLRIETAGVNAPVQRVGVGKSGNMAVPTNYTDVGWYREGVVPGEAGSAVIDGHVDNG